MPKQQGLAVGIEAVVDREHRIGGWGYPAGKPAFGVAPAPIGSGPLPPQVAGDPDQPPTVGPEARVETVRRGVGDEQHFVRQVLWVGGSETCEEPHDGGAMHE
jgi:hypothetical protein